MLYKIMFATIGAMMMLVQSGCGMKGDLVRPHDIPAYEKKQEKKDGSLPL
jgi:predicted small lipoprotein YifL